MLLESDQEEFLDATENDPTVLAVQLFHVEDSLQDSLIILETLPLHMQLFDLFSQILVLALQLFLLIVLPPGPV